MEMEAKPSVLQHTLWSLYFSTMYNRTECMHYQIAQITEIGWMKQNYVMTVVKIGSV
jgi:hypothetical protein